MADNPSRRAAVEADPVFALIEGHAAAYADWERLDRETANKPWEKISEADNSYYDALYKLECEAQRRLFSTKATTVAGVEAFASHVLRYPRIATFDGADFSLTKAISTIAESLRDISASGIMAPLSHPQVSGESLARAADDRPC
jgi:hypothetical protein